MKTYIYMMLCLLVFPAHAQDVAIINGKLHTLGEQGLIANGSVLIRDGRIVAVGESVTIPADATVIDAKGRDVTPGFMDPSSNVGLVEVEAVDGTVDVSTSNEHYTAAHAVADALNPRSTLVPVTRIEGVTRVAAVPSSGASLVAGRSAVFSLGDTDDYLVQRHAAMHAVFGEQGSALTGGSRSAALLKLRELFDDARDYAANRASFNARARRDYAVSRLDLEALQPVLNRQIPLVVSAHRVSDIEALLRFAGEQNIRLVVEGGSEAWLIADQLAAARVPVIVSPYQNLPSSFETLHSGMDNAAKLAAAGVLIALTEGGHNTRNLRQAAGNAVAFGLPHEAALAAITRNAAAIYGMEDFGQLAAGQVADVVIWNGDPLEVTSYADVVLIDGKQMPVETRQTLLRDRYMARERYPQAYDK